LRKVENLCHTPSINPSNRESLKGTAMQQPALMKSAFAGTLPAPNLLDRVFEFNRIGMPETPGRWNSDRETFYTGMQFEELAEKLAAIADGELSPSERARLHQFARDMQALGAEFKAQKHTGAVLRADRRALLDADCDVLVVTAGSMTYQTRHFREAMAHVLDKNDAKFHTDADGNKFANRDANGKILKPAGWTPPDLDPFVEQPID
jgi:predicted HAD superfamily Cof-like phosphohydrolase